MTSDKLDQAIQLIRMGNKKAALPILSEIVQREPNNEAAWIWLHVCVDSISQKKYCLQKALTINPNNQDARNELDKLSITKPISSTLQSLRSSAQSQPPNREQQEEKITGNDKFLLKKFLHYLSIIIVASALVMTCLSVYSIGRIRSGLRNIEATQTQISISQATQTQVSISLATQTQISKIVATQIQAVSERDKVLDGYLTAIEHESWRQAYDYLCAEIKGKFHRPEDMAVRIVTESFHYSLPDGHTILDYSLRPNHVLFVLFNTGRNWTAGPYEAKFAGNSLKICGIGKENGDLRYLLMPNATPLDINP